MKLQGDAIGTSLWMEEILSVRVTLYDRFLLLCFRLGELLARHAEPHDDWAGDEH